MMRGRGLLFTTIEARSKLFGGIAFFTYASAVCYVMMRFKWRRLSRSQFIYSSVTGGRLWDHRDHVIIRLDLSGLRKTRWYEYADTVCLRRFDHGRDRFDCPPLRNQGR